MSQHDFYRILADPEVADRWFLGEPHSEDQTEIDAREFTNGLRYVGPLPKTVPVVRSGRRVQFNLAAFDMPVVSRQVACAIEHIAPSASEQFLVGIQGDAYVILNVLCRQECLDEVGSRVTKWRADDGRPEKTGQYRMVTNLKIDASRTNEQLAFRITGWEIALIVAEPVKEALQEFADLGVIFDKVA